MGLGAGHLLDMINRMKQNRSQRPSIRSKFKENNREGIYSSDKKSQQPKFKIVQKKELNKIKQRIQERAKSEQRKELIIYGILLICGIIAIIVIIIKLNK
ncbi:hypothetical protein [Psychroserpens algicola]|uniref:Uncharacterized protein n=1 Tax=Psychroserpens algicola TaxID=1719034 RepID=A0ABT0HBX7_9FLAO|nr:hypothetical protein [Psychroserpens algicola]MCK8481707.1 hypothetical protein [Psychroserpens algicola]